MEEPGRLHGVTKSRTWLRDFTHTHRSVCAYLFMCAIDKDLIYFDKQSVEWLAYNYNYSWPLNKMSLNHEDHLHIDYLQWLYWKVFGDSVQFSSVQSLSCVQLFASPWIAARQDSLSITNSQSSLKLMSIELVMPSSHLILCHPLFLLPPIPPSIRIFSSESTLHIRWPMYWSFSFSIIPSNLKA